MNDMPMDAALALALIVHSRGGSIKVPIEDMRAFNTKKYAGTVIHGDATGLTVSTLTTQELATERLKAANEMVDLLESLNFLSPSTIAAMRESIKKMGAAFDTASTLDEDVHAILTTMDEFLVKMKMARERHDART